MRAVSHARMPPSTRPLFPHYGKRTRPERLRPPVKSHLGLVVSKEEAAVSFDEVASVGTYEMMEQAYNRIIEISVSSGDQWISVPGVPGRIIFPGRPIVLNQPEWAIRYDTDVEPRLETITEPPPPPTEFKLTPVRTLRL